jgi:hypothetical protein
MPEIDDTLDGQPMIVRAAYAEWHEDGVLATDTFMQLRAEGFDPDRLIHDFERL